MLELLQGLAPHLQPPPARTVRSTRCLFQRGPISSTSSLVPCRPPGHFVLPSWTRIVCAWGGLAWLPLTAAGCGALAHPTLSAHGLSGQPSHFTSLTRRKLRPFHLASLCRLRPPPLLCAQEQVAAPHQRRAALGEAATPLPILSPSGSTSPCLLLPAPTVAGAWLHQEPHVRETRLRRSEFRLPPHLHGNSLPRRSAPAPLVSPGQARRAASSAALPGHRARLEVQHTGPTLFCSPVCLSGESAARATDSWLCPPDGSRDHAPHRDL